MRSQWSSCFHGGVAAEDDALHGVTAATSCGGDDPLGVLAAVETLELPHVGLDPRGPAGTRGPARRAPAGGRGRSPRQKPFCSSVPGTRSSTRRTVRRRATRSPRWARSAAPAARALRSKRGVVAHEPSRGRGRTRRRVRASRRRTRARTTRGPSVRSASRGGGRPRGEPGDVGAVAFVDEHAVRSREAPAASAVSSPRYTSCLPAGPDPFGLGLVLRLAVGLVVRVLQERGPLVHREEEEGVLFIEWTCRPCCSHPLRRVSVRARRTAPGPCAPGPPPDSVRSVRLRLRQAVRGADAPRDALDRDEGVDDRLGRDRRTACCGWSHPRRTRPRRRRGARRGRPRRGRSGERVREPDLRGEHDEVLDLVGRRALEHELRDRADVDLLPVGEAVRLRRRGEAVVDRVRGRRARPDSNRGRGRRAGCSPRRPSRARA